MIENVLYDRIGGAYTETRRPDPRIARTIRAALGGRVTIELVQVPADCTDGFTAAYWRRPSAYLDETVRANMSTFALLDDRLVANGVARLARDLADGSWHSRYASLLGLPELDVGYRLVVAELGSASRRGSPQSMT